MAGQQKAPVRGQRKPRHTATPPYYRNKVERLNRDGHGNFYTDLLFK